MSTVKQVFEAGDAKFLTSNPAAPTLVQGTNFPVAGLAFDATTQEAAFFDFSAFNYGSGNLTVTVEWYADTASANGIVFGASLAAVTPNTDSQDIETKAFATENTASDTHLGTTGQRLHSFDITVSNLDSLAAGDDCRLRLRRVPADGSDTMTGDAVVTRVIVSYSDT
jgi:hypothetical protein